MSVKIVRNIDEAQSVALQALAYLTSNDDHLMEFLALTGLGLDDLRDQVAELTMQNGVMDYILQNETLLLEFARFASLDPAAIAQARHFLPGAHDDT